MSKSKKSVMKKNNYSKKSEKSRTLLKKQTVKKTKTNTVKEKTKPKNIKKQYNKDEEHKKLVLEKARERYHKLKMQRLIITELAEYFKRNGCLRYPDKDRQNQNGNSYKKGYEIRFTANDIKELRRIHALLIKAGFKTGLPYSKNSRFIQPVYGKDSVEKFKSLLAHQKIRLRKHKPKKKTP